MYGRVLPRAACIALPPLKRQGEETAHNLVNAGAGTTHASSSTVAPLNLVCDPPPPPPPPKKKKKKTLGGPHELIEYLVSVHLIGLNNHNLPVKNKVMVLVIGCVEYDPEVISRLSLDVHWYVEFHVHSVVFNSSQVVLAEHPAEAVQGPHPLACAQNVNVAFPAETTGTRVA